MSKGDARILLQDIMDEIERIERFTSSLSFEKFKKGVVVKNLVNALPAMILGDLAGSMVANVTGGEK